MEITMQQQQEANGRCRKGRMTGKSALRSVKCHQEQQEGLTDKLLRSKENVRYHPDKRQSIYGALILASYMYVIYVTNVCDSQKQHQNSNGLKRLFKTKRKREKDKGEVALVVP